MVAGGYVQCTRFGCIEVIYTVSLVCRVTGIHSVIQMFSEFALCLSIKFCICSFVAFFQPIGGYM